MTSELTYLTAVTLFTALMWIPFIFNVVVIRGFKDATGYPDDPKPVRPWALRIGKAHGNAVENLTVFAPLVLVAHVAGVSNDITVLACGVYFVARIVHFFSFVFAIPVVKSIAFQTGALCQIMLAWQLLAA